MTDGIGTTTVQGSRLLAKDAKLAVNRIVKRTVAPRSAKRPTDASHATPSSRAWTVLLVESNPAESILYECEMRKWGYHVIAVQNGSEAVVAARAANPDIVVMDIVLPGMDGIEAMGRMLADNHRRAIVLNTAYAHYKNNFRVWSADGYVVKSADMAELRRTIERVLQIRARL